MLPCNSSVIFVLHDYEAKYCSWWGHLCVCPTQLDHQREPFKLCMHNLAYHTNNGNSQEGLLEREKEEQQKILFLFYSDLKVIFLFGNTFTFSGLSLGRRGLSGTNDM